MGVGGERGREKAAEEQRLGCTHSRTHSLTHSLTRSLTHSLAHSLTHSLTPRSLTRSLTHSLTHSLAHSLTHKHDMHACIRSLPFHSYSMVACSLCVARVSCVSVPVPFFCFCFCFCFALSLSLSPPLSFLPSRSATEKDRALAGTRGQTSRQRHDVNNNKYKYNNNGTLPLARDRWIGTETGTNQRPSLPSPSLPSPRLASFLG